MASSTDAPSFTVSATGQAAAKYGPSQLLAKLRKEGNNKLCDIELVVEGKKEYVHSAVVAVHSKLFYRLVNTEQSPPFSYDLHNFSYDSVKSVIDWMYFGEAKFSSAISSHLAVSAYFEVPELHKQLEQQLIRLGMNMASVPIALAVCTDQKTKVSASTSTLVVDFLLSSAFPNPPLTSPTAKYLLTREEGNLKRKARVVTLVLKWLSLHRDQADTVLEHLQNVDLNDNDEQALITRLSAMVKSGENVRVEVDERNRLTVIAGIGAGPKSDNDKALVSYAALTSPCVSEMDVLQHMAYSPLSSMRRELDKLPNVFENKVVTPKKSRTSTYAPHVERPPGYLPPSFKGNVDMQVQLSTTSTPAFIAYTTAAPQQSRQRVANVENSSIYNDPIAPFTAESIADIRVLPDVFAKKPSNYGRQTGQYAVPSRQTSSVYAQPAPYGPSYSETQPVQQQQQPYLQQYQQQIPGQSEQPRGPVKLELPGGTTVIPHAAHPMLPFSQGYVEVRLPNQHAYPSNYAGNYSEYNQSRFKTSEYAGMF